MSWMHLAACGGTADPEQWFPLPGTIAEIDARAICAGCPVRDRCLDEALEAGLDFGIWGGMNPAERRAESTRRAMAWAVTPL